MVGQNILESEEIFLARKKIDTREDREQYRFSVVSTIIFLPQVVLQFVRLGYGIYWICQRHSRNSFVKYYRLILSTSVCDFIDETLLILT